MKNNSFSNRREIVKKDQHKINFNIKAPQLRVIVASTKEQKGIMPNFEARKLAQEMGLDLVEISNNSPIPVCHIMDYSKFKYEQNIKIKEEKKKQKQNTVLIKEVRLSSGIEQHDVDYKIKSAKEFLEAGKKVKINLKFSKREIAHKDLGFNLVNKVLEELKIIAKIESFPKLEGKNIICILSPLNLENKK